MLKNMLQILACYMVGLLVGTLFFVPPLPLAFFGFVLAALVASPILAAAMFAFLLFRENVLRHLFYWCMAAPFFATAIWLMIDKRSDSSLERVYDLQFLALVFACASISSALFWFLNRRHIKPQPMADKQGV